MIQLRPQVLDHLHTILALIKQHQTSLEALNTHLARVIREEAGVDIQTENWTLDPDTGILTPQAQPLHPTDEEVKDA